MSDPAFTGVDAQTSIVLRYAGGAHAVLTTTLRVVHDATAPRSTAPTGGIEIDGTFYAPTAFTVVTRDGGRERVEIPVDGNGLRFEAAEVGRCLREGRTESPFLPLDETISIMTTMDEIRRQIGLTYPTPLTPPRCGPRSKPPTGRPSRGRRSSR